MEKDDNIGKTPSLDGPSGPSNQQSAHVASIDSSTKKRLFDSYKQPPGRRQRVRHPFSFKRQSKRRQDD
eukprot:scaffold17213_cov93-Skeletonema_menzelii.AAC.1